MDTNQIWLIILTTLIGIVLLAFGLKHWLDTEKEIDSENVIKNLRAHINENLLSRIKGMEDFLRKEGKFEEYYEQSSPNAKYAIARDHGL